MEAKNLKVDWQIYVTTLITSAMCSFFLLILFYSTVYHISLYLTAFASTIFTSDLFLISNYHFSLFITH